MNQFSHLTACKVIRCSSFRRQQVDMPNHRSSNNIPFINLYGIVAAAMPCGILRCASVALGASLRSAVCHTTCSSSFIPHGSSRALHTTSFISLFVPLHSTRSQPPIAERLGIPGFLLKIAVILSETKDLPGHIVIPSLSASQRTKLTQFHYAHSLIHSLQ
jgi:hypothetical protein